MLCESIDFFLSFPYFELTFYKIYAIAVKKTNAPEESLEKKLWKTADKLRKNMDAAEYRHVVMGLIFLKYISDAHEELYLKLVEGKVEYEGADPEAQHLRILLCLPRAS